MINLTTNVETNKISHQQYWSKGYYQSFWGVLIDLIIELLGLNYQALWYSEIQYQWFDYHVIWHTHLIISDSAIWKRLHNVYSQIKQTRLKPLSKPIWQPPPLHPFCYQPHSPAHRHWDYLCFLYESTSLVKTPLSSQVTDNLVLFPTFP